MDKYHLLVFDSMIGEGAQAKVLKCKRLSDDKILAAKMIGQEQMESLIKKLIMNEKNVIKKLYTLNNKNLINIHEIIEDEHQITLIMDYYQKGDLNKEILQRKKNNRFYKASEIIDFIFQIVEGFYQIFVNKIIHRDLKPSNIFLKEENNQITYIIGDFGISKIVEDISIQLIQTKVCTPSYQSPQQFFDEKYSGKTDVFSFGLVIYELIFLNPPFETSLEQSNFYTKLKKDKLQIKDLNFIEGNDRDKNFIQFILQQTITYDESNRMDWRELKEQKEQYLNNNFNQKAQEEQEQKLQIQLFLPKTESQFIRNILDFFYSNSKQTQIMKQYFNDQKVIKFLNVSEINQSCYESALDYFNFLNYNSIGAIYYSQYQQFCLKNYMSQEYFSNECSKFIQSFDQEDGIQFQQWYTDMKKLKIQQVINQCVEKINSLKIKVNLQFLFRDFILNKTNDYVKSIKFVDQFFHQFIMKKITITQLNSLEIPEEMLFYSFKISDEIQEIEQNGLQSTIKKKESDYEQDYMLGYLLFKQDQHQNQMKQNQ